MTRTTHTHSLPSIGTFLLVCTSPHNLVASPPHACPRLHRLQSHPVFFPTAALAVWHWLQPIYTHLFLSPNFHIGGCDTSLSRRDQGGLCFLRYCLVVVPTGESTTLVKESEELYVSPLSFGRRCCTRPNNFSNIAPRSCTFKL